MLTGPLQLRSILDVPAERSVKFERFSDSHASYMDLDPSNQSNYKSLQRAAKAKLKLRLRAHDESSQPATVPEMPFPATRLSLRQKQSSKTLNNLNLNPIFSASEATLTGGVRVTGGPSTVHLDGNAEAEAPVPSSFADARSRELTSADFLPS